jgi:tetratricopeptide (TPR) repeat protein
MYESIKVSMSDWYGRLCRLVRCCVYGFALSSLIALVAIGPVQAVSKIYIPKDDNDIVATVPTSAGLQGLSRLRTALAREPQNFELAVRIAQRYIEISRSDGDPRYLGYAQAALAPWWAGDRHELVLLRATIRQSMHEFDAALSDLKQLNRARPGDAQALLTQATVEQVLGRYRDALSTCEVLLNQVPGLISEACGADARSLLGQFDVYESLNDRLNAQANLDSDTRGWLHTLLAEMLERQGRNDEARRHHDTAVRVAPTLYARAAYADFLLNSGDAEQALAIASSVAGKQAAKGAQVPDVLLLRQVLALHSLKRDDLLKPALADMRARFEGSRSRGQSLHGREEARMVLRIDADAARALSLAEQNWAIQKEAADTLILAQSARAAGRDDVLLKIKQFVAQSGFQDRRLAGLLEGAAK